MNTYNTKNVCTIAVNEDIKAGQFVDFTGNIAKNTKAFGVCTVDTDKDEFAAVKVLGSVLVEAGGVIAVGDKIVADSNGKAIKHTSEAFYEGYATEAGNAGDMIEIIRGI
jgi:hypothetical protein